MGETATVAIIAVAAVGLFLIYEQQQQQAAVTNAVLVKIATPPAANPLSALTSIVGAIGAFV